MSKNPLELAERMSSIAESATLRMAAAARELAAKGHKVYNFAAGEPDFPVPSTIVVTLEIEPTDEG